MAGPERLQVTLAGNSRTLTPSEQATVGRDPSSDLRTDNPYVSRHHARIHHDGRQWLIDDTGSTRGIFYAGQRLSQVVVSGRMSVSLGEPGPGEVLELEVLAAEPEVQLRARPTGRTEPLSESTVAAPPRAPLTLIVTGGPVRLGDELSVTGAAFTIGRDAGADFVIDHDEVSRQHAAISVAGQGLATIDDAGSRNGTFVDGRRITAATQIHDGTRLGIGPVELTVQWAAARPRGSDAAGLPSTPLKPAAVPVGTGMTTAIGRIEAELSSIRRGQRSRRPLILGAAVASIAALVVIAIVLLLVRPPTIADIVARLEPSIVRVLTPGRGSGTGWAYDAGRGLIVTNNHVYEGGTTWNARFGDVTRPLTFVATSPCDDLTVLKMADTSGLKTMPLGTERTLARGQTVIAIGYPGTLSQQGDLVATEGIISVPKTSLPGAGNFPDVIQVDAAINPGNSGGPLVDANGLLIGVNTIKNVRQGVESQGYAIGVDHVSVVAGLLATGKSVGWTGLMFDGGVTLANDTGAVFVAGAHPGSSADAAGIGSAASNEENNSYWLLTKVAGETLGGDTPLDEYCDAVARTSGGGIDVTLQPIKLDGSKIVSTGAERDFELQFATPSV